MTGALYGMDRLLTAAELMVGRSNEQTDATIAEPSRSGPINNANKSCVSVSEIEIVCIGVFSLLEARFSHLYARGPFFKQLCTSLTNSNQSKLAHNLNIYYLSINVLKHGAGQSYNLLCEQADDLPFSIKKPNDPFFNGGDESEPEGLINIQSEEFLLGLLGTLRLVEKYLGTQNA